MQSFKKIEGSEILNNLSRLESILYFDDKIIKVSEIGMGFLHPG